MARRSLRRRLGLEANPLTGAALPGEIEAQGKIPYAPGYTAPREAQAKPSGPDPPNRQPLIQYSGKTLGSTGTAINSQVAAMKALRSTRIKTPNIVRRKHG